MYTRCGSNQTAHPETSRRDVTSKPISKPISTPAQPFLSTDLPTLRIAEPGIIVGSRRKGAVQYGRSPSCLGWPNSPLPCQHIQGCDIVKTHVVQFPASDSHDPPPATEEIHSSERSRSESGDSLAP
jgi:hypothetical protein